MSHTLAETKAKVTRAIKALGKSTRQEKRNIVCAIAGHSRIITNCLGYVSCARCEEQIGDALGGFFDGRKHVIIDHNCRACKSNYKNLTWVDKYLAPNPFPGKKKVK